MKKDKSLIKAICPFVSGGQDSHADEAELISMLTGFASSAPAVLFNKK